jgi:hypothetical protein
MVNCVGIDYAALMFVSKRHEARSAYFTVPHPRHQPNLTMGPDVKNMSARIRLHMFFIPRRQQHMPGWLSG